MYILTNELIEKFQSRDPIEIAKGLGIRLLYEELGMINGYYNEIGDLKFIHINNRLSEEQEIFTAAHELGHSILHERTNVLFLHAFTHERTGRMEYEANLFATFLLISDEVVEEYKHLSVPRLMTMYNLNEQLIIDRFFN